MHPFAFQPYPQPSYFLIFHSSLIWLFELFECISRFPPAPEKKPRLEFPPLAGEISQAALLMTPGRAIAGGWLTAKSSPCVVLFHMGVFLEECKSLLSQIGRTHFRGWARTSQEDNPTDQL
ncbi:hypothetical protein TNCT_688771 [Trichonephila clavata]|uniref:Uncharacterized protein n=1 Tax=Trichonephila clavata TaxID=2740835 RepID=A0A8X6LF48_TRICU|nr:hypothetical protein TNCT_688771 [Trichonephila clavata]